MHSFGLIADIQLITEIVNMDKVPLLQKVQRDLHIRYNISVSLRGLLNFFAGLDPRMGPAADRLSSSDDVELPQALAKHGYDLAGGYEKNADFWEGILLPSEYQVLCSHDLHSSTEEEERQSGTGSGSPHFHDTDAYDPESHDDADYPWDHDKDQPILGNMGPPEEQEEQSPFMTLPDEEQKHIHGVIKRVSDASGKPYHQVADHIAKAYHPEEEDEEWKDNPTGAFGEYTATHAAGKRAAKKERYSGKSVTCPHPEGGLRHHAWKSGYYEYRVGEENEEEDEDWGSGPSEGMENEEWWKAPIRKRVEDYLAKRSIEWKPIDWKEKALRKAGFQPRALTPGEEDYAADKFMKNYREKYHEGNGEENEEMFYGSPTEAPAPFDGATNSLPAMMKRHGQHPIHYKFATGVEDEEMSHNIAAADYTKWMNAIHSAGRSAGVNIDKKEGFLHVALDVVLDNDPKMDLINASERKKGRIASVLWHKHLQMMHKAKSGKPSEESEEQGHSPAFHEGKAACADHWRGTVRGAHRNPYAAGTRSHGQWEAGFQSAEQGVWDSSHKGQENEEIVPYEDEEGQSTMDPKFQVPGSYQDQQQDQNPQPTQQADQNGGGQTFELVWKDGKRQEVQGKDIADAFAKQGYGPDAVTSLDYWEEKDGS